MLYPTPIAKLIDSFSKLPGIGAKTATRLAFIPLVCLMKMSTISQKTSWQQNVN